MKCTYVQSILSGVPTVYKFAGQNDRKKESRTLGLFLVDALIISNNYYEIVKFGETCPYDIKVIWPK